MPAKLEHEKLAVYDRAIDVAVRLDAIAERIPERRGDLRDQLRRASASVALNIAEGAGEFSPSEKAKFYRFARRSACECSAVVHLASRLGAAAPEHAQARAQLAEVCSMLTGMVKPVEARRR